MSELSLVFIMAAILIGTVALTGLGLWLIFHARTGARYVALSNMAVLQRRYKTLSRTGGPYRRVIYVGLSLHKLRNVHSQNQVADLYNFIRKALLQAVGQQPDDLLANYDGKNFVLLTQRDDKAIQRMIDKLVSDIETHAASRGIVHMPQIHYGCYTAKSSEVGFYEEVSRAKQAYKHAERTKTTLCFWDFEMLHDETETEDLELQIRASIERDDFILEFQPFVDAHTGAVIGGEVLTRLNLPGCTLVQPARFLRAVAGVGLHSRFDYYVFEKCCAWASCQRDVGGRMRYLSCNFSRYTIGQPDFPQKIIDIADRAGVDRHMMVIEMTEEEQSMDTTRLTNNLTALRDAGFPIFLDDFGCGFTSLMDLRAEPIDVVKVDKSVLDNAAEGKGQVIFRHIMALIRELGYAILCEGVETAEQLDFVRSCGCDIVQGYYFYRPLPADEFQRLLSAQGRVDITTPPTAQDGEQTEE